MIDLRTQLFRTYFRLTRSLTLGARAVVEDSEGRVLLVRQTYTKGLYFPGGGVEHNEPVVEALIRELHEEGGIDVIGRPDLIGVFSNHRVFRNDHVLLYRVPASAWTSSHDPIGREISELVWADPLNPPADTTDGTARRLKELYEGHAVSVFW